MRDRAVGIASLLLWLSHQTQIQRLLQQRLTRNRQRAGRTSQEPAIGDQCRVLALRASRCSKYAGRTSGSRQNSHTAAFQLSELRGTSAEETGRCRMNEDENGARKILAIVQLSENL